MAAKLPPINTKNTKSLLLINDQLTEDPYCLDDEKLKYSTEVNNLIERLITGAKAEDQPLDDTLPSVPLNIPPETTLNDDIPDNIFTEGDIDVTLAEQNELIYSSLLKLRTKVELSEKIDPNKVMTFYKNLGTLLEKIVELRERGTEAKEIHDFKNRILDVLDEVVTPEQRNKMLELLGHHYIEAPIEENLVENQ